MRLPGQLDSTKRQLRKAAWTILSVFIAGTACGASEGQVQPAAPVPSAAPKPIEIPASIGRITVKQAGDANSINDMLTPGTVQQVPTMPEIPQTPESIEKVHRLEAEFEKYFSNGGLDQALIKCQEAYGLCLEMKYAEGQGRALTNMCRYFLARGQWVKARFMGENALEVLQEANNKKDLGRVRVCLAQAYFGLDNPVWAGEQLTLALKEYEKLGESSARESADLTSMCGGVLLRMGKYKEALIFFQASAQYLEQAGDIHAAVVKRIGTSMMMIKLGLYVAAMEEADRALSLARSGGSKVPTTLTIALANAANAEYALGEFGRSLKTYEEANQLSQKLTSSQFPEASRANLDLGYAHALLASGYPDTARQKLERSMSGFKKLNQALGQAQASNALGMVEEYVGQHEKAAVWFQKALDLQSIVNPKQDRFQIEVLQNLAACESRSGNNRMARVHLQAAIDQFTRPKNAYKDALQFCRTLSAAGEVCLRLADIPQAEKFLRRAVELGTQLQDDASLWRDYTLLARIPSSATPPVPVSETLNSALSHFRSPQAGAFSSPERLTFPTSREELGAQLVAQLAKQQMAQQALLATEQLKDELFIVEWNRRGGQVKPEDADMYRDLMTQRAHLHAAEDTGPPSMISKEWQAWMSRFKALVQQNRRLARLIAPVPTTIEEIVQSVRTNHATIVDYLVGSTSTVAFTVDGAGRLSATVLPVGKTRLKEQIASLVNGTARQGAASPEEGPALERNLLATLCSELMPPSVRRLLPSNPDQTVVIVPDGPLFNLPFSALITDKGRYLIEQHTLTMAPSLGLFMDSPPRYTDDLSLMVASSTAQGGSTGDESSQIAEVFQPELVTRLVGRETPVSIIQEQSRGKAVVHFVSKVPLQERNPLDTILPLAPSKEDGKKVTADRLFGMSLANDLMVWSGSSVLGKDLQGNAVKVFSRGLNYAGVRNVLMSLWSDPNSQRTEELVEFYKQKQAGLNQAQSLRRAQMLALSRDPSPRSWAAFQLLGPGF